MRLSLATTTALSLFACTIESGPDGGGSDAGDGGERCIASDGGPRLVGITANSGTNAIELRAIDRSSGQTTLVATLPGIQSLFPWSGVANRCAGKIHLLAMGTDTNGHLFTIDAASGAVLKGPTVPLLGNGFVTPNAGLHVQAGGGVVAINCVDRCTLTRIDPDTGSTTTVATVGPANAWTASAYETDVGGSVARWLSVDITRNNSVGLLTVDLATGQTVSWPLFDGGSDLPTSLCSRADGGILALKPEWTGAGPPASTSPVYALNPQTAALTPLDMPTISPMLYGAKVTDVAADRVYLVIGPRPGANKLVALDAATGAQLSAVDLAPDSAGADFEWAGGLYWLP